MSIFNQLIDVKETEQIGLLGMTDEFFCLYLYNIYLNKQNSILVVTPSLFEANKLVELLSIYCNDVLLFPMDDFLTSEAVAVSPDLKLTRLETLNALLESTHRIVVTHLHGYLRFLPTKELYKKNIISLALDDTIDPKILQNELFNIGYVRETIVTKTGEIAIRGFVIDVFPVGEMHPYRIEFFGDTIESIRMFDEDTQKSIEVKDQIMIKPASEFILDQYLEDVEPKQKNLSLYASNVSSIFSYLDQPMVYYKDFSQMESLYSQCEKEMFEYHTSKDVDFKGTYMHSLNQLVVSNASYYMTVNNVFPPHIALKNIIDFQVKSISPFHENIDIIHKFLRENLELGKTIVICLKDYQLKNLKKHLNLAYIDTDEDHIVLERINFICKSIGKGFQYKNYIFLGEQDLFSYSTEKKKYKTNYKYSSKIKDIHKLVIGDYIVHNTHGIGVYNGIKTLAMGNIKKDYLEVLYQGKDKLYIPVEKIDLISKYSGRDGMVPKINKLGSDEWQRVKQRVRAKVKDIAEQLIQLYAKRELQKGFAYQPDTEMQLQFEKAFSYDETKDQLLAVEQIKKDMESSKPMDRLLCGDVGYGKTEVAFRAIFKAVMDSKQVLYLCPTTILSNQHYENAIIRFKEFPVNFALLNRFTSKKEVTKIIQGLSDGTIDVVFGTHRLLSNDIKPKDLGLLIIDEEQRFGVAHKEKIKQYKTNVDVLTLTATPIPRTLQMSMVGIRSLSLIETPPVNRYPVQTYVIEENDQIIKDAIYKELSRNGQVFLLYNNVSEIENQVQHISNLVKDARIIYAHGQMSKVELENRMLQFIQHEYDVLICTTIIETGIDIPNVNTLIILDADRFGLSQLYQIRGRVGRSNKIAYAYLMYHPAKLLTESALKRLNVIKEFTELGSGFSIATRDLSIRGAGDILGSEQAGFIDTVGIDLYLKILNEEVSKLKGEQSIDSSDLESSTQDKPLINVETHIADDYVIENDLKIEIHKKINQIDSYEKLQEVKEELEDRFGKISENILIYMYEEWFEKLAKQLHIEKVVQTKNSLELHFDEEYSNKIDTEKLFVDAFHITTMFRFQLKNKHLIIILDTIKLEKHSLSYLIPLLEGIVLKKN